MLLRRRTDFGVEQWIFMPTHLIATTLTLNCSMCMNQPLCSVCSVRCLQCIRHVLELYSWCAGLYDDVQQPKADLAVCAHTIYIPSALYDVTKVEDWFLCSTVDINAHARNCNYRSPILQYVYEAESSTSLFYTILAMCMTSFRVVQLMYRLLRWSTITPFLTLGYAHILYVCHHASPYVIKAQDRFWCCTVDIPSHTLKCNNHNPTLQWVYESIASTILLYTMLGMCMTRFGVVQLMQSLLWWYTTTTGLTLWCVNTETCHTYYQHRMKCTDLSSSFVHHQQGRVLIVSIKCVGVNIQRTSLKPSVHDTNRMHSIMAYLSVCT